MGINDKGLLEPRTEKVGHLDLGLSSCVPALSIQGTSAMIASLLWTLSPTCSPLQVGFLLQNPLPISTSPCQSGKPQFMCSSKVNCQMKLSLLLPSKGITGTRQVIYSSWLQCRWTLGSACQAPPVSAFLEGNDCFLFLVVFLMQVHDQGL